MPKKTVSDSGAQHERRSLSDMNSMLIDAHRNHAEKLESAAWPILRDKEILGKKKPKKKVRRNRDIAVNELEYALVARGKIVKSLLEDGKTDAAIDELRGILERYKEECLPLALSMPFLLQTLGETYEASSGFTAAGRKADSKKLNEALAELAGSAAQTVENLVLNNPKTPASYMKCADDVPESPLGPAVLLRQLAARSLEALSKHDEAERVLTEPLERYVKFGSAHGEVSVLLTLAKRVKNSESLNGGYV
jgi:hypothetical protein